MSKLPTTYEGLKGQLLKLAEESGDAGAVEIVKQAIADTDEAVAKRKAELDGNPTASMLMWGAIRQAGRKGV